MANQYTGSKWTIYDEQIKTILYENKNISNVEAGKKLNLGLDCRGNDALSIYIKRNRRRLLDDYEGVFEATETINVANKDVPYYWDKSSKEYSFMVKNPNYEKPCEEIDIIKEIDFLSIFKDKIIPINVTNLDKKCESLFDRLVISDIHIGMDVNKDGYSLYDGNWNEEILFERLEIVVNQTILNQKSDLLLIHDLGDYLDGFDGFTTRGGHKLPQNMDNQKMFDVGLKFKILLIDSLINHFNKIKFVNICNDNHAGSFGYIVNSAFKAYI